jgi:hypothetical protein
MSREPTSGFYADGSYGFRARRNGDMLTLWFCRGWKQQEEPHDMHNVCVHRSRADARACPNRPKATEAARPGE